MSDTDPRRALPAVDTLLAHERAVRWAEAYGHDTVRAAIRRCLEAVRGDPAMIEAESPVATVIELAGRDLEKATRPSLRRVRNGTGVVLHTNLGRASLAEEAVAAQARAAAYGNVEFSLDSGKRGSRYDHCTHLLRELTGAQAAVVTNNNAAAVSLCVNELARDREVVVSRGELVEIGGTFRIPDVVSRSGATLREVGTTNRTRAADYASAIAEATGMLLRVHPSNYRVEGFTVQPEIGELSELARERGVPFVHDVGSGLLDVRLLPGFPPEPTVADSLAAGVDLVTFSGDKLLGGPQAGLIVGRADLVARLRSNPLLRAFRVDKTTLAALEATLMLYRDFDLAAARVPTLRMLRETAASVEDRARAGLSAALAEFGEVTDARSGVIAGGTTAVVGGGSFPGFELESFGWIVSRTDAVRADDVAAACRALRPPLIGRIHDDSFVVDVRTIPPGEEAETAAALLGAIDEIR